MRAAPLSVFLSFLFWKAPIFPPIDYRPLPFAFSACRMKEAAELEVAELAKAAARADSMARAAHAAELGAAQMLELQRLKVGGGAFSF